MRPEPRRSRRDQCRPPAPPFRTGPSDEQIVVCLNSLTTILQYADDGPALAFLRELLDHCEVAGALTHVHLDPSAIDEQTIEGVRGQVDETVRPDESA
ncbi:DUF7504 family protein [Salinarchaeum laminariae]|uniref:DUF7504 family protein n=1 Tax=Salinarchaeum laminariae TaxID=869888 RepID=UPI004046D8EF